MFEVYWNYLEEKNHTPALSYEIALDIAVKMCRSEKTFSGIFLFKEYLELFGIQGDEQPLAFSEMTDNQIKMAVELDMAVIKIRKYDDLRYLPL